MYRSRFAYFSGIESLVLLQVPIKEKRLVPAHVILNNLNNVNIPPPSGAAQAIMSWDDDLYVFMLFILFYLIFLIFYF